MARIKKIKGKALTLYKEGHGRQSVVIFFHVTHSAGTTICKIANDAKNQEIVRRVPSFACGGTEEKLISTYIKENYGFFALERPLPLLRYGLQDFEAQNSRDGRVRVKYTLPFGLPFGKQTMLVMSMRDPILRLLSDLGKEGRSHYHWGSEWGTDPKNPAANNIAYELDLEKVGKKEKHIDTWEYNLRWLGDGIDENALSTATVRMHTFQIMLIVELLGGGGEGAAAMLCTVLGWKACDAQSHTIGYDHFTKGAAARLSARKILSNDDVYYRLVFQNRRSLRLYKLGVELCIAQMKQQGVLPKPPSPLAVSPTYASAVAAQLVYDYAADIKEAEARYKRKPFHYYCFDGMKMIASDDGGCANANKDYIMRCSCPV
jgi:hypothetical protein